MPVDPNALSAAIIPMPGDPNVTGPARVIIRTVDVIGAIFDDHADSRSGDDRRRRRSSDVSGATAAAKRDPE
jgi:hypothetical protein